MRWHRGYITGMATERDTAPDTVTGGRVRLRQWIDRSKLNQLEAAEVMGFDKTALNHILTGKRTPGLQNALKIERATGIPVEAWVPSVDDTSSLNESGPVDPVLIDKA